MLLLFSLFLLTGVILLF